jgi:hypothetical protein
MNVVALLASCIVAATDAAEHKPDLTDYWCDGGAAGFGASTFRCVAKQALSAQVEGRHL